MELHSEIVQNKRHTGSPTTPNPVTNFVQIQCSNRWLKNGSVHHMQLVMCSGWNTRHIQAV